MDSELKKQLYAWLKTLPFLKNKNVLRSFADGHLVARLVNFYLPKSALECAYPACNAMAKKIDNWTRLNEKVFSKLGIQLSEEHIRALAHSNVETTEQFLLKLATVLHCIKKDEIVKISTRISRKYRGEAAPKCGHQSKPKPKRILETNGNGLSRHPPAESLHFASHRQSIINAFVTKKRECRNVMPHKKRSCDEIALSETILSNFFNKTQKTTLPSIQTKNRSLIGNLMANGNYLYDHEMRNISATILRNLATETTSSIAQMRDMSQDGRDSIW
ncbi:hypothetical protein JTE90_012476 [Oedothorax gibbosus]|uniref:Calponin-homology (CH) domain-containing protein n=1 Tax=Oedothorax gibbosus TaxID=931172 RepID=A0AAV6UDJ7_9ARAC|nr:hypothetical protein JTE90_012476 [Oedothorax gibbosus]